MSRDAKKLHVCSLPYGPYCMPKTQSTYCVSGGYVKRACEVSLVRVLLNVEAAMWRRIGLSSSSREFPP